MRTFEQYILEAKQNYIFGGTDDRNTNISAAELLSSLKAGDDIYLYSEIADELKKITFFKFRKNVKEYKGISIEVKSETKKSSTFIYSVCEDIEELDISTIYSERKFGAETTMRIISTDEKEFLHEVNKFSGKKYTPKDIVDSTAKIFF